MNLSFLGKVIERAIAEQLQKFLDDTWVLDPFQSSFGLAYGMEMALFTLTDDLHKLQC